MAAKQILHYTAEDSRRSAILRKAGYLVEDCACEADMSRWFEAGRQADLVCISETMERPADGALALARAFSAAPVVLFQVTLHYYAEKMWDLEVPASAPPKEWLAAIAALFEQRQIKRQGEAR